MSSMVPHVGVEWRAVKRESWQGFLRGGYEYDKSPIGPQAGATNYVDSDRHAFSAGVRSRRRRSTAAKRGPSIKTGTWRVYRSSLNVTICSPVAYILASATSRLTVTAFPFAAPPGDGMPASSAALPADA